MPKLLAALASVLTPGAEGGTSTSLPHVCLLTDSVTNTDVEKIVGTLHLKKEKPTIVTEIT